MALASATEKKRRKLRKKYRGKLGQNQNLTVEKGIFRYHGVEATVPPLEYALDFASKFPYQAGMPGPSFTWSAFASSYDQAIDFIQSNQVMSLVLERLDESLVVASHYLNWSLADLVVTVQRKSLSSHPKPTAWPSEATKMLQKKLQFHGEYKVYNASNFVLDRRIGSLKKSGVKFDEEVILLKELKKRVTEVCLNMTYLENYRSFLERHKLRQHPAKNKLRDVDEAFAEKGHIFSFNREVLGTFDVCGSCEAHALLYGLQKGLATSVLQSTTLSQLTEKQRKNNVNFLKCPSFLSTPLT